MSCDKNKQTDKPLILTTGGKGGIVSVVLETLMASGYALMDLEIYTGKCCA